MTKITKNGFRTHAKASERYVDVIFEYDDKFVLDTSVPIEYRRTGIDVSDEEIDDYLEKVYTDVAPSNWPEWYESQEQFWIDKPRAKITKPFFDALAKSFSWTCATCSLPKNPNFARRIQDLKEFGYTLATNTSRHCPVCKSNKMQLILLPIRRGGITGYETWSPDLREKIIRVLGSLDSFEAKVMRKEGLLPDHKFPEIRWDAETRRESLEHLTDDEIKADFQLLTNQRNQQKREVCRTCFQNGDRGRVYGVDFYYQGTSKWDVKIPKKGKDAVAGCVGCGWYDISTWRNELNKKLV
ncbi:MAG: restriction endonuclease [Polaromonas sp.]|nr:restriction endonuclease [Polaromonas sp.]